MITITIRTGTSDFDLSDVTNIIDKTLAMDPRIPVNVIITNTKEQQARAVDIRSKLYVKYSKSNIKVDITQ